MGPALKSAEFREVHWREGAPYSSCNQYIGATAISLPLIVAIATLVCFASICLTIVIVAGRIWSALAWPDNALP